MQIHVKTKLNRSARVFAVPAGYCLAALMFTSVVFVIPVGEESQISGVYGVIGILILAARLRLAELSYLLLMMIIFAGVALIQFTLGLPPEASAGRILPGTILICFVAFSVPQLMNWSAVRDHQPLMSGIRFFFWAHIALQVIMIGYVLFLGGQRVQSDILGAFPRDSGLAAESSHVSILLAPLVFMAIIRPQRYKKLMGSGAFLFLWLSVFVLGLSATAFGVVGLALIFRLTTVRKKLKGLIGIAAIIMCLGLIVRLIPMVQERFIQTIFLFQLPDPIDINNFSTLIFLKGLQTASIALDNYPFGVGILNMRSISFLADVNRLGREIQMFNNDDGSSLLFKGISEFGVLYLLFLIIVVTQILRRLSSEKMSDTNFLEAAFLFVIVAESIRGTSYFTYGAPIGIGIAIRSILAGTALGKHSVRR